MALTIQQIEASNHISTSEIKQDVSLNNRDIELFRKKLEVANEEMDRWEIMKAEKNLRELLEFQDNLLEILAYREAKEITNSMIN